MLVYAAAPALSTQPYVPAAVDFEQALDRVERVGPLGEAPAVKRGGVEIAGHEAHDHLGEGPVSYRSGVIGAPARFDLAGLAGEMRPLELRARERGGEWSGWIAVANGDPAYFGGAEELQLRARGWRPAGTIHYVNVSGTASGGDSLLTRFRRAVNSAVISAAGVIEPSAEAQGVRPPIVTRGQWGAKLEEGGCPPRERASYGQVKAATIHHTATAGDYSALEAPSVVLGICRYHRNANGWNDIGYNALVDRFGTIYAGRAGGLRRSVIGAHAQGFNTQTTGVAAIGTHTETPISPETMNAFVEWLAWKLPAHGLRARGKTTMTSAGGSASRYPAGRRVRLNRVIGHGRVGLTSCPGEALDLQLGKIRRGAQSRIDGAEYAPPAPPPDEDSGSVLPK